jgi:hypothetical protein
LRIVICTVYFIMRTARSGVTTTTIYNKSFISLVLILDLLVES